LLIGVVAAAASVVAANLLADRAEMLCDRFRLLNHANRRGDSTVGS